MRSSGTQPSDMIQEGHGKRSVRSVRGCARRCQDKSRRVPLELWLSHSGHVRLCLPCWCFYWFPRTAECCHTRKEI